MHGQDLDSLKVASFYQYYENEQYEQAIELGTELHNVTGAVSKDNEDYLKIISNLADCHYNCGNTYKAIELDTQVLELSKKFFGESHPSYANLLNDLAVYYSDLGDYDKAIELGTQAMETRKRLLGEEHPLFVYIPCGVGGAPGGITFGLKQVFGDNVHCFFVEPVQAPCMLAGMASGLQNGICVQDIGLTGQTIADGLAVGRPSGFACARMKPLMSGAFTVADEKLPVYQKQLMELEGIRLEPSACAGFRGLADIGRAGFRGLADIGRAGNGTAAIWKDYIEARRLSEVMDRAVHIVWGTGGGLMPAAD